MQNLNDFEDFEPEINYLLSGCYKEVMANEELSDLLIKIKDNELTKISNEELQLLRYLHEYYEELSSYLAAIYK
jgi:hypothetical protein